MKGSNLINDLTPENRDNRNGDFTGEFRATPSFTRFMFMLCFIVTCKNFLMYVWGENIKSPIPGLSEPKIRTRYNRQSIPGVASCIGLRDQSHIVEAFWR